MMLTVRRLHVSCNATCNVGAFIFTASLFLYISCTEKSVSPGKTSKLILSANPADEKPCLGAPTSFSVTAAGSGTLTYQWESSSGNLTGGHYKGVATNTIAIDSVLISDTSTYTCLVADAAGDTVLSSGARLTVKTYIVKFNSNGGSVVDSQKTACIRLR